MESEKTVEIPVKNEKKRIEYFDIAKGIGIFLVVWAHAKAPFQNVMYQFHMPLFMLISGMLYNTKSKPGEYIVKKVKSLYIPFVFWNLSCCIIKAIVTSADFKATAVKSLEIILTLSKDGEFFGATWFLGSLFVISVVYKLIDSVVKDNEYKPVFMAGLFCVFALTGFCINFPFMISRTIILSAFFAIGVFVKNYRKEISKCINFGTALVYMVTFIVISHYNSANMGKNEYKYPILFFIGAVFASYAVIYFCRFIEKKQVRTAVIFRKVFLWLGKNSIDILIWQFVFFRVGIIIQMALNHEAITLSGVLSYYPLYSEKNGWWIIYTVIGLILPVLWGKILRFGPWGKLLKKAHIV